MIKKCLIANRGEIAVRILRTCKKMGITTVIAHSLCDKNSLAVQLADESVCIGPDAPALSYMNMDQLCEAALLTHCDAITVGYGFLSESADFAKKVEDCGLTVVGVSSAVQKKIQNKQELKKLVSELGISVIPGAKQSFTSYQEALPLASQLGFPVMLKPCIGGGGRGIRVIESANELKEALAIFPTNYSSNFYMEKYIHNCRHIEVQILADKHQTVISVGTRNCTMQLNHQKFIEEAPFLPISSLLNQQVLRDASNIAKHLGLDNVSTIEFLIDEHDRIYFMEINPRIQVEHPLTEMIFDIDIVEQQFLSAMGEHIRIEPKLMTSHGYAIECRINAQNPTDNFMPDCGKISALALPSIDHVRIDTALLPDSVISANYDSLLAKVIVWGQTREQALSKMSLALDQISIEGISTNLNFLRYMIRQPGFVQNGYTSELFTFVYRQWKDQRAADRSSSLLCPGCHQSLTLAQQIEHQYVCPHCRYHFRIPAKTRISYLIDQDTFTELDAHVQSIKYMDFPGYTQKISQARLQSGLDEAVICGIGKIHDEIVCIGVLDASFMMGSMGHAVGDKITRLIETAKDMHAALIIVSASGGARMQEGIISLMQMAKTASALQRFDETGGLFISVLTDPTTGGVTASFAMLGDILISEPQATIGFAGRRVIEKTIRETLPSEFQRAEYVLDHGCLDMIVDRSRLKQVLADCLKLHRRDHHG